MRQLLMATLWVALASASARAADEAPTPVNSAPAPEGAAPSATPGEGQTPLSGGGGAPGEIQETSASLADAPRRDEPIAAPGGPAHEEPAAARLVSGAPLDDPSVAVHIVQRKRVRDTGRHELALYPAAIQANVKFTEHLGTAASYTYHLHENFGLQITPQYNWYTNESAFNHELIVKVREEAQAATSLLLVWGALGGVEVTPLYGKFAFYEGTLGHFTLVLNGGVGVGATRHQLRPEVEGRPASYGDTGMKLLGSVGGGLRFHVGERFALRLEVRDLVYTARVDQVNGCNLDDLTAMNAAVQAGERALTGRVAVRYGCELGRFEGEDPSSGQSRMLDVPLAKALVETPTSDALNNVGFYVGFAILF